MIRTFTHSFTSPGSHPIISQPIELTVEEIEDAGLREVLQTPGARFGSWAILDSLLEPTGSGTPFVFTQALGGAREVKVALSGLFGRFVARAYLERYCNLSIFAHLGQRNVILNGQRRIEIKRLSKGDLPDWVACAADLSNLTVAEAKGCHDKAGPAQALARAWTQAGRIDVMVHNRRLALKRLAVATRWGIAGANSTGPFLSVHDPEEKGDLIAPEDSVAAFIGLFRLHIASLLLPLGYPKLSELLRELMVAKSDRAVLKIQRRSGEALDVPLMAVASKDPQDKMLDELVGNMITRVGPISALTSVSESDQRTLERLNLRPIFVGVRYGLLKAIIEGDPVRIVQEIGDVPGRVGRARTDRSGGWIIPVGGNSQTMKKM